MTKQIEFGVVGLGRMGGGLALQALEKKMKVVGFNKGPINDELKKAGLAPVESLTGFKDKLRNPRIIFLYIPAGPPVDDVLDQLANVLENGDILVDGGNSYWGDSLRRHEKLKEKGLEFIDLGTSGGVDGARNGACFMAGGEDAVIAKVEPILKALAVKNGYVHAGPPSSGHFTKLVHNGIEFGMLQAIGEGMNLLEEFRFPVDIKEVLKCWGHGSVIRSWLIDLMEKSYREEGGMQSIPAYVEDTGEVNWLVNDALHMEVPVPVIAQSVMQLFLSRDDKKHWSRAIAMMRHGFGGHPYGNDESVCKERREGQINPYPAQVRS